MVVSTTAGATVRHLVSAVFDRAMVVTASDQSLDQMSLLNLKGASPSGKGISIYHSIYQLFLINSLLNLPFSTNKKILTAIRSSIRK